MSLRPDQFPMFQRRPARAVQFDPQKPKEQWPEGVIEYKPRSYELRIPHLYLMAGDWIVYDGAEVRVMAPGQFEQSYEPIPQPFKRGK